MSIIIWSRYCLLLAFIICQLTAFAQVPPAKQLTIDSLQRAWENATDDSVRVDAMVQHFAVLAPFDNSGTEALQLKVLSICDSLLSTAIDSDQKRAFQRQRAKTYGSLGVTYYMVANHVKAQDAELAALDDLIALADSAPMARCYIILGAIYKEQNDLETALKYHSKARDLSEQTGNERSQALALNNIGTTLLELDSIRPAEKCLMQSLALYEKLGDKRGMGVELLNLGSVQRKLHQLDSAVMFFQQSLAIREEIGDEQGLIFSHMRLGLTFLDLEMSPEARFHALASAKLAEKKGYARGLRDANELLYKVYEKEGKTSLAFEAYKAHIAARDSMKNEEHIRKLTQAEYTHKYEAELLADSIQSAEARKLLQSELALQESQSQQRSLIAIFLGIVLLVVAGTGYWIYQRYRQVKAQREVIAKRNEEKELLLKEIHHRVKNNLQVVSSLLDLQSMGLDSAAAREAVGDGQNRVKAMALIHEKLYQNEDISNLDFGDYALQLIRQIRSLYSGMGEVEVEVNADQIQLDIDTAVPLGLILSELLTNSFKYAFADGKGKLHVHLKQVEPSTYEMTLRDDGPGLPESFDLKKAKSLGLKLVRRLSKQLYGNATYSFDGGACFTIRFLDTAMRKSVS